MSAKIEICGNLKVRGWHNKACEILSTEGVSTCIHCQSNNLLQKILLTSDINNMEQKENKPKLNLPPELQGKKFRIRKLTPRECFRLMGVNDADIDKIQASGISNSSQYKLAGNSIVAGGNYTDLQGNVDGVLYNLFRKMFIETGPEVVQGEAIQLELF